MLNKLLKRFRVSEVHLCLPFVQITMEAVPMEATVSDQPAVALESSPSPHPELPPPSPPPPPSVNLAVQERPALSGITISPLASALVTELSYRIATHVDGFGPVFPMEWHAVERGMELRPGDYLWLRLYCRNASGRVVHKVRIAMEGIEMVRKQEGILIRGANGWPRVSVRDVFAGQELAHLNPEEEYSLHCVLRVPVDIATNPKARFTAVKPEFNILKQLV